MTRPNKALLEAAIESERLADQVDAVLRRAGIDTWLLDGTQALALLWERLHPAAELTEPSRSSSSSGLPARARSRRRPRSRRPPSYATGCSRRSASDPAAGIDIGEHPAWLRHGDGTLEETIHLATPPLATDPSWLAHLLSCPLPATLAVHIGVGVRSREKHRQRRRWQRLAGRGPLQGAPRPARRLSDEEDALEEAAVMDAELAAQVGATVYRGRDLLLDPRPVAATPRALTGSSSRRALTSTR